MSRGALYSRELERILREQGVDVEGWSLPEIAPAKPEPKEQALNIKRAPEPEPEAYDPEQEQEPEPLTAEALEAIRQAAYEEGFAEGKEDGFAEGKEEGRLSGLQQGHEAGLAQGIEQGLAEGKEQLEQQVAHWQQLIAQLQAPLAKVDKVVEQSLITLVQQLARNLLKTEATTSPQLLLATLQEAIAALPSKDEPVTLYLHPDDAAIIEQHFDEDSRAQRQWKVIVELAQTQGDIKVATALSELDIKLAQRIDELMSNFMQANWSRFNDPT